MGMAKENQFHVLAVDDSIIDRMLIERLLKTSSFQGNFLVHVFFFFF
jgi:two-component response regulator (ARR-A family)